MTCCCEVLIMISRRLVAAKISPLGFPWCIKGTLRHSVLVGLDLFKLAIGLQKANQIQDFGPTIHLDKIERNESYKTAPEHKEIYEGLVKSYNLDKDLFSSYGKVDSLNRDREGKDKDEDPPAGSNQGLKKWKTSKDTERETGSKSKDSTSSSFKGTKSQQKSSGKSV
ncbi:hypothetical protein Tco_0746493 [Tanacetum coccineum]